MNQMLRPQAMRQLTDALDRAVASNPALAGARQILLHPLKLLEAVGQEMAAALANQPAALDRLRLLLQLSAATALETKRAFESTAEVAAAHGGRPCEGSVIRMGGLVVAGLAAGRVGRRMSDALAEQMVDVIHGVALSASPAESLARSLQNGLLPDQVTAALDGLASGNAALTRLSAMAPMFLDACERARWECLRHLFDVVKRQVHLEWEGSASGTVKEVLRARKGQQPSLVVHFVESPQATAQLKALDKKDATCVLASADGCLAVWPSHVDKAKGVVTVPLPTAARAGWVGVATRDERRAASATRAEISKFWTGDAGGKNDCLRGAEVPVELFGSQSDDDIYPPPPLSAASWGVRILDATVTREGPHPTLSVSLARADQAARVVAHLAGVSAPLVLAIEGGEATVALPASLGLSEVSGTVEAFAKDRPDPDDERKVFSAAPTYATGGASAPGTLVGGTPGAPPTPGSGTTTAGTSTGGVPGSTGGGTSSSTSTARRRYVAVIRPVFVLGDNKIDRVSTDQIQGLQKALATVGVLEELPFVRDDELVVNGPLGDLHGPSSSALMEKLAVLAARTSGLEDATLLALIPASVVTNPNAFAAAPSDAVTAIVLATPGGAAQSITPVVGPPPSKDERLRLVGRIFRDDIVLTEPIRSSQRAAGPGASFLTSFVAVGLDDRGETLIANRIRVMSPSRSGPFATLLPVTPEVASIELRFQPETLAVELRAQPETVFASLASIDGPALRIPADPLAAFAPVPSFVRPPRGPLPVISRPSGAPGVSIASVDPKAIAWDATHTRGVRGQIEIEAGHARSDGSGQVVWSRVDSLGAGPTVAHAALGLERPLPGPGLESIRVVVSDGWNAQVGKSALAIAPGALRIRAIDGRRYWLDLASPRPLDVSWSVWDPDVFSLRQSGPIVTLRRVAAAAASAPAPLPAPRRPPLSVKITEPFAVSAGDGKAVLLASFDGQEDWITLPAVSG